MALLGSSVDPRLFVQDYSGFTRAADIQSQSMANIGANVGSIIKGLGENYKDKKQLEAGIKATVTGIESAIKMGESLGIRDIKSSLTPYLDKINDPNVSPIEAAAYAKEASNTISNALGFGMKANELAVGKKQYDQSALMEQAKMQAEANKPGPVTDVNVPGGVMQMRTNPRTGVLEPIQIAGIPQGTGLVDIVKELEGFNPKAYSDYKQTSVGYGTKGTEGEVLTEAQATDRLNTELSGHAKRIEEAAKLKGVKFNQNQFNALTSFDFNTGRGADLIERFGDKPEELVSKMQEYTKAGGEELPGLVKRRGIEAALFMTPTEGVVGFKPTKTEKQETPMTAQQVQNLVAQGFKVNARPLSDGSFMVSGVDIGGQSGETIETTREGVFRIVRGGPVKAANEPAVKLGEGQQLVADPTSPTGTRVANIPGGKAEQQAQQEEAAKELTKARGLEQASVALDEIDRFIEYTGKMSKLPFASPARRLMATAGMEQQSEAESSLDTVKANLKFEALDALRKASPSGASGLGQVTQNEFSALADQWGTLRLVGDPEKIQERALSIKRKLLDTVHGNQAHRDAMLKKGVITPQQYNDIQSQYPNGKQVTIEDARIDRFRKVFSTQPTQ